MATDFLNQPLEVRSVVIFTLPRYADITVGVVVKLTPQKAHVAFKNYSGRLDKILIEQDTVCVIDNAVATKRAEKIMAAAVKEGWLVETRCPLCDYQHGHAIGCTNNPIDIALHRTS